jgi:hypothetical protein
MATPTAVPGQAMVTAPVKAWGELIEPMQARPVSGEEDPILRAFATRTRGCLRFPADKPSRSLARRCPITLDNAQSA